MKKKRYQWQIGGILLTAAVILGGLYYYGIFARQGDVLQFIL